MASFVKVEKFPDRASAVVTLNRPPVNALNTELIQELIKTIDDLERDASIRGMVLTSALGSIFSAGLDITLMINPDRETHRQFWTGLQTLWMRLYITPLAVVVAIIGHCPAGGCVLSLTADYRIMIAADKFKIGLNETQIGLVAPSWFMDSMCNVIGFRQSERLLQRGELVTPKRALEIGLIDETAPDRAAVLSRAHDVVSELVQLDHAARSVTKIVLRTPTVEEDARSAYEFVTQPHVQATLSRVMMQLAAMKDAKARL